MTQRSGPWWCALLMMGCAVAYGQSGEAPACPACHEQGQSLEASAHAAVSCAQCHPKHSAYPHEADLPKVACAACHSSQVGDHARSIHGRLVQGGNSAAPGCAACHGGPHDARSIRTAAFRSAVPETCGACHSAVSEQFAASVHGKAIAAGALDAAVCSDCHGEHSILPSGDRLSSTNPLRLRETCGRCHGDVRLARRFGLPADRLTSFDASFHGLAAKSGSQTVASCSSCHGYHDMLPSTDPKSRIHPANLAETCGQCHPGAGRRFAIGPVHFVEGESEPAAVRIARIFYLTLIPVVIGLMLLHHGGDWVRELLHRRLRPVAAAEVPDGTPEVRMYPWERVQHALLAVSFVLLVWTGFALKYADHWWARPLVALESAGPVRSTLHRIAGAVLIAVAALHVLTLVSSSRLRTHWRSLLPRRADLTEAWRGLAYRLGLLRRPPAVSAHSYVEKVEYWSVVWGTLIMAITGLMLWANDFMLAWLPKSWLDFATTVHFYEAVLATLAIAVWHLYSVIFDPDVYPMDPAWLTGQSVRARPTVTAAVTVEEPVISEESVDEAQQSPAE